LAVCPSQIVAPVAVTTGPASTETLTLVVFEQPFTSVPVTLYVLVDVGLTDMLAPVAEVLHVYVFAPDPVRVELLPGQTDAGLAEADTVGNGFTVTVAVADPVQPTALVPVTEYVVVETGETEILLVLPPVFQL